jgi:hypothetical protein
MLAHYSTLRTVLTHIESCQLIMPNYVEHGEFFSLLIMKNTASFLAC